MDMYEYNSSFATFSSNQLQLIDPHQPFIFNTHSCLLNIHHIENTSDIIILQSGIYVINIIIYLKIAGTVAFLKNNTVINNSITYSNLGNTNILIHFITSFIENDILKLINYDISGQLICENSKNLNNIDLTIIKIYPTYNNISPSLNSDSLKSEDVKLDNSHKEWIESSSEESGSSSGSEESGSGSGSGTQSEGSGSDSGTQSEGSGSGSEESGSESGSGSEGSESQSEESSSSFKSENNQIVN